MSLGGLQLADDGENSDSELTMDESLAEFDDKPCSRARAAEELRLEGEQRKTPATNLGADAVDARLAQCFQDALGQCQHAIDTSIEDGIAVCRDVEWGELPANITSAQTDTILSCLQHLKGKRDALAGCISTTSAGADDAVCNLNPNGGCEYERDKRLVRRAACMVGEDSVVESCSLVTMTTAWKRALKDLRYSETFEEARQVACASEQLRLMDAINAKNVTDADTRLAAAKTFCTSAKDASTLSKLAENVEQLHGEVQKHEKKTAEAKAAAEREAARCGGVSTGNFVMYRAAGQPLPKNTRGCRYGVFGRVVSGNDHLLLLAVPTSTGDGYLHALRTNEAIMDGTLFLGGERRATFEGVETVTFAGGGAHRLPVFKLLPQ